MSKCNLEKEKSQRLGFKFLVGIGILRFISPFLIWWNLLWGFCVNFILDWVDGSIILPLGVPSVIYQTYDKLLDLWWYILALIYSVRFPQFNFFLVLQTGQTNLISEYSFK